MPKLPVNLVVACALALAPLPAMAMLDQAGRGCGDGLCGFIPGLLIFGGLLAGTLAFDVRSARRAETPAFARWLPLPLWILALAPMVL